MKKLGLIIIAIGVIITLITGFNFVTQEKVIDIGNLDISRNKTHSIVWSPLIGIGVIVIGGGILILGIRKQKR